MSMRISFMRIKAIIAGVFTGILLVASPACDNQGRATHLIDNADEIGRKVH